MFPQKETNGVDNISFPKIPGGTASTSLNNIDLILTSHIKIDKSHHCAFISMSFTYVPQITNVSPFRQIQSFATWIQHL